MVDIRKLTEKDIGKWVSYTGNFDGTIEIGKIKSWNDKYIFVVYKCANEWNRFEEYTATATRPEDLEFTKGTMSNIKRMLNKKKGT